MTEQEQMVEDCENREERLSDWDRGFIDSIAKRLRDGFSLTTKQVEKLDEIWTIATEKG
jgi:hypothetical protein